MHPIHNTTCLMQAMSILFALLHVKEMMQLVMQNFQLFTMTHWQLKLKLIHDCAMSCIHCQALLFTRMQ